jgi:Uma2 family endonuclease
MHTALARKTMTVEEFTAWAEAQPEKHWELFDGVPELQQSTNWGHARHVLQVVRALDNAISQVGRHELFVGMQGLVVKAGPQTAFEPDVVVFAGEMADVDVILQNPLIVFEVLSASTARKDLTVKLAGYFNVPSIMHYAIVDWEAREVIHHRRLGDGLARPEIVRSGELRLDSPGITLSLADIFKG